MSEAFSGAVNWIWHDPIGSNAIGDAIGGLIAAGVLALVALVIPPVRTGALRDQRQLLLPVDDD